MDNLKNDVLKSVYTIARYSGKCTFVKYGNQICLRKVVVLEIEQRNPKSNIFNKNVSLFST